MTSREFDLATVISVAKGVGLTDMEHLRELLNYMTNRNLPKAMLSDAVRVCRGWLLSQNAQLASLNPPMGRSKEASIAWLKAQNEFGRTIEVTPLPTHMWEHVENEFIKEFPSMRWVRQSRYRG